MFVPHLEILPEAQRKIWPNLARVNEIGCVLYGGTALALHFGHRISEDFDFFTSQKIDEDIVLEVLPVLKDAELVDKQIEENTFVYHTKDDVKISIFGGLNFGRTEEPLFVEDNGIYIASVEDIFADKLKTLLYRVALKDYLDISAIIQHGYSLEKAAHAASLLYEKMPSIEILLKTLCYFDLKELKNLTQSDRQTLIGACKKFSFAKCCGNQIVSYGLAPSESISIKP